MKQKAILIASLTIVSLAAQNQPGQSQADQRQQSSQQQSQQDQQKSSSQASQQAGQQSQSSQGKPGESQSSSATSSSSSQKSAAGAAGQSQSGSQGQFQQAQQSNLQQFIDYKVVDKQQKQIGTVEALWEDETGQPAFLAIKRQQQGQQARQGQQSQQQALLVVPAQSAEVNKSIRTVRIPYQQQVLQNAPTLTSEQELNAQAQNRITAFYRQHGYQPRQTSAQGSAAARSQGTATSRDGATITLKEESVNVGTRQVDAGGVLLKKIVRTDTVSKPVELQSEEIVIERVEGTGRPVQGEIGSFEEKQIYIPLRREVPVVEKEVEVKERINIGKDTETERRQISEKVREEDLKIIKEEGTDVQIRGEGDNEQEQQREQRQQN